MSDASKPVVREPMYYRDLIQLLEPSPHLANWLKFPEAHSFGGAILLLNSVDWRGLCDDRYLTALETLLGFTPNFSREEAITDFRGLRNNRILVGRFRALAMECLKRGDATPLLLTLPSSEKNAKWVTDLFGNRLKPTGWLEGYTDSEKPAAWMVWDMGECFSLGGVPNPFGVAGTALRGNNRAKCLIDYEEGKIMPDMESVGYIRSYRRESFGLFPVIHTMTEEARLRRAAEVLDAFATMIVNASPFDEMSKSFTVEPSQLVQDLVQGIPRCLPSKKGRVKASYEVTASGQAIATSSDAESLREIEDLWRAYIPLVDTPATLDEEEDEILEELRDLKRQKIVKQLVACLDIPTRIDAARNEMSWNGEDNDWECTALVRCRSCEKLNVYRLNIWEYAVKTISHGMPLDQCAQVWRFPGLELGECTREGVGLVVQGTYIIGKMRYGTGGCNCVDMEHVDLGPYTSVGFYDHSSQASGAN